MYTINNNSKYEINIKNSKFITLLYKVTTKDDTKVILDNIKKEYSDATHYCYAYIIDNFKKADDDGEPSGTAGMPILKILEDNNLNYIIAIVIRYFGGIKLGANGLIRAYSKCVSNALKENNIKKLIPGYNINITFNFTKIKYIDYLLKDIKINKKLFLDIITYNIDIPEHFIAIIKENNINYHIIKNIYIEK